MKELKGLPVSGLKGIHVRDHYANQTAQSSTLALLIPRSMIKDTSYLGRFVLAFLLTLSNRVGDIGDRLFGT